MKLSTSTKAKKKLASAADLKKVKSAAKVLLDFNLITAKRAMFIARNF
jgi:hypothetical protein